MLVTYGVEPLHVPLPTLIIAPVVPLTVAAVHTGALLPVRVEKAGASWWTVLAQ